MSQRARELTGGMSAAEARAFRTGAVRMARAQLKGLLCKWENLTEEQSDWEAEQFLNDLIDAVGPSQAGGAAAEGASP